MAANIINLNTEETFGIVRIDVHNEDDVLPKVSVVCSEKTKAQKLHELIKNSVESANIEIISNSASNTQKQLAMIKSDVSDENIVNCAIEEIGIVTDSIALAKLLNIVLNLNKELRIINLIKATV
jgi:hypothetical protein